MDAPIRAPFRSQVLAEDLDARVECIELATGVVLRKTYAVAPLLVWRTFLRRSRAQREAANLMRLRERHVPVIDVLFWSEDRVLGCVVRSTIATEFVGDARNLDQVLRSATGVEERRALARVEGQLLGALHRAAFCSTTASPRNILVTHSAQMPVLRFIDQPHLMSAGRGWLWRRCYEVDLYDAFFSRNRVRDWNRTERWRALLEYSEHDVSRARAIWRRLSHRPRWVHAVARELTRLTAGITRWKG